jgi:PGF-pre-PGF domain-containing protein
LTLDEAPANATVGTETEFAYTVTNTGDASGDTTVTLSNSTAVLDSSGHTLDPGESQSGTLRFAPSTSGEHALELVTGDDSVNTSLMVYRPPAGSVSFAEGLTTTDSIAEVSASFRDAQNDSARLVLQTSSGAVLAARSIDNNGTQEFSIDEQPAGETVTATLSAGATGETVIASDAVGVTLPSVVIEPTSLDLGDVLVGNSATSSVEITNNGDSVLELDAPTIAGTDAAGFSQDLDAQSIQPGETIDLSVTANPADTGEKTATIELSNADGVVASLPVSVQGVAPDFEIDSETLAFGSVSLGDSQTERVTITSTNDVETELTEVDILDGQSAFSVEGGARSLDPSGSVDIPVTFSPQEVGAQSGTLELRGPAGIVGLISLEGTGEAGQLSLNRTAVQFDADSAGDSPSEAVRVTNKGNALLTIESISPAGNDAGVTVLPAEAFEVQPGEHRDVHFSVSPEANASFSSYFAVEHDGSAAGNQLIAVSRGEIATTLSSDGETRTVNTTYRNVSAGQYLAVDFPTNLTETDEFEPDLVEMRTRNASDAVYLEVQRSRNALSTTPETNEGISNNAARLSNVSIRTNIDEDEIEFGAVRARVNTSTLEAMDTDPGNVSLYRFDESAEAWEQVDTEVGAIANGTATLITETTRFSEWTAAAARPAFSITDANVDVNTLTTDESVTIQVFVENTGGTAGTFVADLLVDDEVVDSQEAIVAEEGEELFQFEEAFDTAGTYTVQVNNVTVESVTVTDSDEQEDETDETDDTDNSETTEQEDGTDESAADSDDESEDSGGFGPGFGPLVAVGAIVAFTLIGHILRRRSASPPAE